MGIESCPDGRLCVLCGSLLLYERVERDVYGFGVEDVEITKVAEEAEITEVAKEAEITEVAEEAEITEVAEMAEMFRMIIQRTTRHVLQPITEYVRGIQMTARHVIRRLSKMAEAFSKTARHVM
jgi:hypothetical protein